MILKQSTAATVVVGPVLDSAGAAVTTAVAANFSLSKNGTVNALTSETVTHSTNGYYTIALTSSNTDTLGRVEIIVNDSAMSMATHRYNVIVGTSYDLLVTSGGYSTLDAAGIRTAVGLASANLDTQLSTIDTVVDNIETDTQDIQSRLPAALVSGRIDASVGAMAANTITASALASDAVDEIALQSAQEVFSFEVEGVDGFGVMFAQTYDTIDRIEVDTQDIQSRLPATLVVGRMDSWVGAMGGNTVSAAALASDAVAEIADAVWDESYNQHTTAGSFGKLMDTIRKSNTVIDGTVTATVSPTTTSFSSNVNYPTGAFKHSVLLFLTGPLAEQNSPILTYNNTNGVITVEEAFTSAPQTGNEFIIIPTTHVHAITAIQAGLATSTGVTNAFTEIKGAGWSSGTDTLEEIAAASGGGSSVNILPASVYAPKRGSETILEIYIGETIQQSLTVYQSDGTTPLNLAGKTLEVVFDKFDGTDVVVVSNSSITVSGANNNVATFAYPSAAAESIGTRFWALRDASAPKTVYAFGQLKVLQTAFNDP